MQCPYCKSEVEDGIMFCSNCGQIIGKQSDSNMSKDYWNEYKTNVDKYENERKRFEEQVINDSKKKSKMAIVVIAISLITILIGKIVTDNNSKDNSVYVNNYNNKEQSENNYNTNDNLDSTKNSEESVQNVTETVDKIESDSQNLQQYILPGSNTKYLTKADLIGLTAEECRLARNEIYARHGRMFSDESLQKYFETFSWYNPIIQPEDFDESILNIYETANRDLIVEYEMEQGYR